MDPVVSRVERFVSSMPPSGLTVARDILEPILEMARRLSDPVFRVTVLGASKTGKSSLLNLLIGADLLPVRGFGTFDLPIDVRYGPVLEMKSVDGSGVEETVPIDRLRQFITHETGRADRTEGRLLISIPLPLLLGGAVLVDTPGLHFYADVDDVTEKRLSLTDLAIVVLAADKLLSAGERVLCAHINRVLQGNVVFVLNRMDAVDGDDRDDVLEWAHVALRDTGNNFVGHGRLFPTSTARDGFSRGFVPARDEGLSEGSSARPPPYARNAPSTAEQRGTSFDGGYTHSAGHVSEFLSWLTDLLVSERRSRVALISRLGVTADRLELTAAQIHHEHGQAARRAEEVRMAQLEQTMTHRTAVRRALLETRRRLEGLKPGLREAGKEFVTRCVLDTVETLVGPAGTGSTRLKVCGAIDQYVASLNEAVTASLSGAPATAPRFDLSTWIFRVDVGDAIDPATRMGVDVGGAVTRIVDGGQSGREAGAAVGGWIGKHVLGRDSSAETVGRIETAAAGVLTSIEGEALRHIDVVLECVQEADVYYQTWSPTSGGVEEAESQQRSWAELSQWVDGLMRVLKAGTEAGAPPT